MRGGVCHLENTETSKFMSTADVSGAGRENLRSVEPGPRVVAFGTLAGSTRTIGVISRTCCLMTPSGAGFAAPLCSRSDLRGSAIAVPVARPVVEGA